MRARLQAGLGLAVLAALVFHAGARATHPHEGLFVWTASALEKVRPADRPGPLRPVELAAARNEFEPFQLVLRAERAALRGVDVEAGDLVHADGEHRIPAHRVAIYLERYIELAEPSSDEGDRGEWPDALVPRVDGYAGERRSAFPFDLAARRNQALWIEVYVPVDSEPGIYQGELRITAAGRPLRTLPWRLQVWPFTLPSTATLRTSFGFSGVSALKAHYGAYTNDEDLYRLTRLYERAALRHRLSFHGGTQVPPRASFGGGRAQIDWAGYDREVGPLLDGTLFGRDQPLPGARVTSIDLRTQAGLDPEQTELYWRAWAQHFRARGWLGRLLLYIYDEPAPADYPKVRELALRARRADRGIPVLLTEQLTPELVDVVDIWTPLVNCFEGKPGIGSFCEEDVPRAAYTMLERRGARVWWYQSCCSHGCGGVGGPNERGWPSYAIDAPAAAHRISPWLAWQLGIEGELYYNTVEAWADATDPWTDLHRHGGNGDGTLFYPGTPARIGGTTDVPVESLRLKLIREGLEDYEYLVMLAGDGEGARARAWARSIAARTDRWEHRPDAIYGARKAIGNLLAARRAGGG